MAAPDLNSNGAVLMGGSDRGELGALVLMSLALAGWVAAVVTFGAGRVWFIHRSSRALRRGRLGELSFSGGRTASGYMPEATPFRTELCFLNTTVVRQLRDGSPFEWVVPHTHRKTVATLLDESGTSARQIADQLGHARVSMTQDVYMGRKASNASNAAALEAHGPDAVTALEEDE